LLAAQAVFGDDAAVTLDIDVAHVIQKTTAPTDQLQQATPAVVVTLMGFQVIVEVIDALGEDGNLHFRGTGIGGMERVRSDCCWLIGHEKDETFLN
jgi:hypothetical protein